MRDDAQLILTDGKTLELGPTCTIGRQEGNQVVLDNGQVSRQHALVQWQMGGLERGSSSGGYLLIDLGSSNGTYVNGLRLSRPVLLADGDVIEIGGNSMTFRSDAPARGLSDDGDYGSTLTEQAKRPLWLMVADIIGSTRMANEIPVEEVPKINGAWFKSCRELVESHRGQMNQYLGDGFFCYWEDSLEAQHQIPALLRHFRRLQAESQPSFRVVLHYGVTVLGNVPTLSSLNLHGPNVNFVFRMEKLAGGLGEKILLSDSACEKLGLPALSEHQAAISGFDGSYRFLVPDLGDA